ncbi:hypothetical protein GM661_01530 [Iocasia frigidifontis]|uniref:DUF6385 domain-containing protein n=1 Tax=Iocasia fonsfrigidae TaxID=2682810 RepID=A0A8A7K4Y7_9FIRM|nr:MULTISPECIES: DUF6385 domain-containing protein [Halanaerobiaceae]AZO93807.1 hypothetical protein D7D81_03930 [Halocella sp. SP3-1]MTI59058.1 hypothetical protein [Bacillota bacterium]QTL96746.1 hypothetical protein GM661_01530 [Iocasia fonsfrigidae]
MPNFKVRNFSVDRLKTQIFGTSTENPIATDSDGLLRIRSISDAISVDMTGTVDIRDLTASSDSIEIYGFDGTNIQRIQTDTEGNIRTHLTARDFSELTETGLVSTDAFTFSEPRDNSEFTTYSFAVYNSGATNSIDARLEVSADTDQWYADTAARSISAASVDVFFPASFLKYTRVAYRSTDAGNASSLDIFFQAQL